MNNVKKILVYDDDVEILLLCSAILKRSNYNVITREKCDTIIEDIKEYQPNAILMDLWIPEIGGEQAIEKAKTNQDTAGTPIIIFSANEDIKSICEKVHANDYLPKPFNIAALNEKIQNNIT